MTTPRAGEAPDFAALPAEPTKELLTIIAIDQWPEDWDAGKAAQRRLGIDVIPPNVEMEVAYGQYQRLRAALAAGLSVAPAAKPEGDEAFYKAELESEQAASLKLHAEIARLERELSAMGRIAAAFGDPSLHVGYLHDGLIAKRVQDAAVLWQGAVAATPPAEALRILKRYGQHDEKCAVNSGHPEDEGLCDCGYDDAVEILTTAGLSVAPAAKPEGGTVGHATDGRRTAICRYLREDFGRGSTAHEAADLIEHQAAEIARLKAALTAATAPQET